MLDHISFVYFIQQMAQHPVLLISVLLTLGVIFVNGWPAAPNDRDLRINQMHRCGSRDHYGGDLQFLRSNGHVAHQFERGDDHKEHGKFWRKQ